MSGKPSLKIVTFLSILSAEGRTEFRGLELTESKNTPTFLVLVKSRELISPEKLADSCRINPGNRANLGSAGIWETIITQPSDKDSIPRLRCNWQTILRRLQMGAQFIFRTLCAAYRKTAGRKKKL